ncbi:MAG: methylenetetrahydrofolate reductase, partial [Paramuribaculum sp.]|nr:methylenetetrahydrofolate reductase [Paramuribaculum sp.]
FFDNSKFYSFVNKCREVGITVPIIPGIKPIVTKRQLTLLPKVFHVDMPEDLANEIVACKNDEEAKEIGVRWCTEQMRDLYANGVPSIHLYSLNATNSVRKILENIM